MAVAVSELKKPIAIVDTYRQYQAMQGIPRVEGFAIENLNHLELGDWPARGGKGAFINLEGSGGTNDAYVCEIAPGGSLNPQKHLYEEMIFILEGVGATSVWNREQEKISFEWGPGSLFAIPMNAWHQHFNAQGSKPVRYVAVTNAPTILNLFHNLDFVFDNPWEFGDRFNPRPDYFNAKGELWDDRILETNFVPDAASVELYSWKERGANSRQVRFELSHNTMAAHISQFPDGSYKKAHRHGPGAHVIILVGTGYSLLWPLGSDPSKDEAMRVDWQPGTMVVPPADWFHMHLNTGPEHARYLALRWGSRRYEMAKVFLSRDTDIDVKSGGAQIEYGDENPQIHERFEAELATHGHRCRMRGMVPWCTGEEM